MYTLCTHSLHFFWRVYSLVFFWLFTILFGVYRFEERYFYISNHFPFFFYKTIYCLTGFIPILDHRHSLPIGRLLFSIIRFAFRFRLNFSLSFIWCFFNFILFNACAVHSVNVPNFEKGMRKKVLFRILLSWIRFSFKTGLTNLGLLDEKYSF